MTEDVEDNKKLLESLVDKATDYGKTSYELVKLKSVDKASDVISSVLPHSIALVLASSFMLFLNLGLALWFGEILGKSFYGFFVVAVFYIVLGTVVHFFFHKPLKKIIRNYVIK